MNPVHLVWLLPLVAAVTVRATLDVVAIVRRRRTPREVERLRRALIEQGMATLRTARGVTHHPVVMHHFNEWEAELTNQGEHQ